MPSMPVLVSDFATTSNIVQLTMTAWFAGVALPQLFFGPLTDRYGRKPILLAGALCFLLSTLVCTAANQIFLLIIARFFQGVGVCSLNVATFGILADLYDSKNRTKLMNKINMCANLAPLLGPIIGGYVLTYLGWRMNFVLIFILALVSILGLLVKLPESNMYLNPHALNVKNIYKNYLLLIRTKGFLKHLLPYSLMLSGVVVYLTAAPFLIIRQLHVPAEYFGYTQLPVFISFIVGSLIFDRQNDDQMMRKVAKSGVNMVLIAGVLFLIGSFIFGTKISVLIVPMVIYALGFSLCGSFLVNEVMTAGSISKGSAAAFLGFAMAASCVLASTILGLLYDGTILANAAIIAALSIISAVIFFSPANEVFSYEQN